VTGGTGYIGSHICVELLQSGHQVVIVDNFYNSDSDVLEKIHSITGKAGSDLSFVKGDVRDRTLLNNIFSDHSIDMVVHLAGLKAVGESVEQPLKYYDNNVNGTLVLCSAMQAAGIKQIVFSSSATVYGYAVSLPINESYPLSATNPYGRSKLFIEQILQDIHSSDPEWRVALLRYFNPIGAHRSGLIGDSPNGIPNNLMPYICKVAEGCIEKLQIFGGDYPTSDGTGVRDYIHVVDLAKGHLAAIDYLVSNSNNRMLTVNFGTGEGYSVLNVVSEFEKVTEQKIPYEIVDRRTGDIAECYADASSAREILGWKAEFGLRDMCMDSWRFWTMSR